MGVWKSEVHEGTIIKIKEPEGYGFIRRSEAMLSILFNAFPSILIILYIL